MPLANRLAAFVVLWRGQPRPQVGHRCAPKAPRCVLRRRGKETRRWADWAACCRVGASPRKMIILYLLSAVTGAMNRSAKEKRK